MELFTPERKNRGKPQKTQHNRRRGLSRTGCIRSSRQTRLVLDDLLAVRIQTPVFGYLIAFLTAKCT
jgi:hypothetical protein